MIEKNELSEITTSMFASAIGHASWNDFLSDLSTLAPGVRTHLFGFDTETNTSMDLVTNDYDPEFITSYDAYFFDKNLWADGFAQHPAGKVVDCEDMCRTEVLVQSEFYHDWLKPQEDIIQGGGALLFKNPARVFVIGGNIRLRDEERIKAPWLSLVGQLIPHMQQAFEISRALAGAQLERAILAESGLKQVPGIAVLSGSGRIVFANDRCETMIQMGMPVAVDRLGKLIVSGGLDASYRSGSIDGSLLSSSQPSRTVHVRDYESRTKFTLRFASLSLNGHATLPIDPLLGFSERCTLLVVTEEKPDESLENKARAAFGLTQAESEVASLLTEGLSIAEIADRRVASVHTVRNQMKAIMAKLSVSRQAEAVRLLSIL